ncbi:MAG: DUF1499 domain-containing protein [Planctomycetota bacterium]
MNDDVSRRGLSTSDANNIDVSAPQGGRSIARRLARRVILIPIIGVLAMITISMTATQPADIGFRAGRLAELPKSPNCVSTQTSQADKKMDPIPMTASLAQTIDKIKSAAGEMPRSKLVREESNYLHFEFTSLIFRFVDDVEFLIDEQNSLIHFRSASRVGHSDLGVNRKRMKQFCEKIK